MSAIRVDRRLFLTADRKRIVAEDDPDAAYLYAAVGDELNEAEARQYGLLAESPQRGFGEETAGKESRPAGTKVLYPSTKRKR